MRGHEKRRPENGGSDGEMVIEMAGAGAKFRGGLAIFVETIFAEAGVGFLIVAGEIEIVLDQRSADESVVAHAVTANPGIKHGQGEQKEHEKQALRLAGTWLLRRGQTLQLRKKRRHATRFQKQDTQDTSCARRKNSPRK